MTARIRIWLAVLLLIAGGAIPVAAQDAVPALIQVGGTLLDQNGQPLTGPQAVTFALYKDSSGDTPLWVEVQTVTPDAKGRFAALLGATSPGGVPLDLFRTGQARWLGMQAAGQAEQPRTFLASVPYTLAPLSALSDGAQPVTTEAPANQQKVATAVPSSAKAPAASALSLPPASPLTSPVFTIVTDEATSGLASAVANNGATVKLNLIKTCANGQMLKWNGTAWGCTADTDVTIDVTGGGLNVLANATSPNIVGGFGGNTAMSGVIGATVAGGGESNPDGALCLPFPAPCNASNSVAQSFGTVGGGESNQAGDSAGVASTRSYATVGGGRLNVASGLFSTVPGGSSNTAAGSFSFAAGFNAKANHNGSFVWADHSSISATASTGPNQFLIRATGGVRVRGPFNLDDATNNGVGVLQFPTGAGLFFRSGADNAPYIDRMFISGSTGRVGIGTTTPSQALDVAGSVAASGDVIGANVRAGGDLIGGVRVCIGSDCRASWPAGGGSSGGIGGLGNSATGHLATVAGGFDNTASGDYSAIGGGQDNTVSGLQATIAGGWRNVASGFLSFIGGGEDNIASEELATASGSGNKAVAMSATISGGSSNTASGPWSTIGGGVSNTASGHGSTISGGLDNKATQEGATVAGGQENEATGLMSLAAGHSAKAVTDGTFVWADNTGPDFVSKAPNQFLIRAAGGVGIGTESPTKALDVVGGVRASELCISGDCRAAWPAGGGTITAVTTTSGLTGGGTTGDVSLGVNFDVIQKRVTMTCPAAFAVRSVNSDGSVNCEPVGSAGLTGTGGVNFLSRFTGPNAVGSSTVFDDGSNVGIGTTLPFAKLDVQAGNTHVAGAFESKAPSGYGIVARATDSGSNGASIGVEGESYGVNGAGIQGVGFGSNGRGVIGSGGAYGVTGVSGFPGGIGRYFANASPGGKALVAATDTEAEALTVLSSGNVGIQNPTPAEALDVNGNVKATAFYGDGSHLSGLSGGGTITGVTPGDGLTGGGTTGSVALGIANGGVTNAMLHDSVVSVKAGAGLSGGGAIPLGGANTLTVDFTTTQKRLSNDCAAGNAIQSVGQDGIVGCVSVGSSGIGGSGAQDAIPKFLTGGVTVGNSRISDNGTDVKLGDDASGRFSVLGNGLSPNIVGGHKDNSVSAGAGGTIAGGGASSAPNVVTAPFGAIGGGLANSAGNGGVVAGGNNNDVAGDYGAIGGGRDNRASGGYSTVPGGRRNIASGDTSFAAGFEAEAAHEGTFVWADQSAPGGFTSTDINQFLIRAKNGVGIGTPSPTQALDVVGNVKADGLCIGTDCRTVWPSGAGAGTITGVTADAGLTGGGTSGSVSLGVDFATTQKRVSGSCESGGAIQTVHGDGTVACATIAAGIGGAGTPGKMAKFITPTTLGDSQIFENPVNGTVGFTVLNGTTTASDGFFYMQATGGAAPNIVAGFGANVAAAGIPGGNTISGGGNSGSPNHATGGYGTIGGGYGNTVATEATIGGGSNNTASLGGTTISGGHLNSATGVLATVSGGNSETASGSYSTVAGGDSNVASASYSFAAGRQAMANHSGTFVWGDSLFFDVTSTAANEFTARATGGVRFISAVSGSGAPTAGVRLAPGAGSWSSLSDRNAKENFSGIDGGALLAKLNAMRIETWNYKSQDAAIRHIGPMAQDFAAAFGVGEDDTHISGVDADGVALAGVQALYRVMMQKDEEIARQQRQLQKLQRDIESLQNALSQLLNRVSPAPGGIEK